MDINIKNYIFALRKNLILFIGFWTNGQVIEIMNNLNI